MEEWMANVTEALITVPLNQLAIPGSHDSGSFMMTKTLSPSAPSALKGLAWIPGFASLIGGILIAMSTTQSLNIGQQLDAGIRHLDFRVSWWKNNFYFIHSVYGTQVSVALDQMRVFLDNHPKEVVILDMQQFHQMDSEHHKKLIALLKTTFGSKFLQPTDLNDITLRYMWEKKKTGRIICIYQSDEASNENELWSSSVLMAPWPDTSSAKSCINKLTGYMNDAVAVNGKFSICQAVLTPDTVSIMTHLFSDRSVKTLTKKLNPVLRTWLSDSSNHWDHLPNVVLHDFVEMDDYVRNVLDLNKHRIAKM